MKASYKVTGTRRKEMVRVIGNAIGITPVYMRVPTCAYRIGDITVSKAGELVWDERADKAAVLKAIRALSAAGFMADDAPSFEGMEETETAPADEGPEQNEPTTFTITLPRKDFPSEKVKDLKKLLQAKEDLIKKALEADSLDVEVTEDTLSFPWFSRVPSADEVKAYTRFITALVKLVRKTKRITASRKEVENEKYSFRCFLLRLGFIGERSKADRKILLRNLSGSAAFKAGKKA